MPDAGVRRTPGPPIALLRAIFAAELQRVHAQLLTDFVHDRLRGKLGDGRARRAVGGGFGLVYDHIVAIYADVAELVGREDGRAAGADRRAGIAARIVGQVRLRGGEIAFRIRAHLDANVAAGRRSGRHQHLRPIHHHLDRPPGLFGKYRRHRLQIDVDLTAEAAADFGWNDFNLRDGMLEDG